MPGCLPCKAVWYPKADIGQLWLIISNHQAWDSKRIERTSVDHAVALLPRSEDRDWPGSPGHADRWYKTARAPRSFTLPTNLSSKRLLPHPRSAPNLPICQDIASLHKFYNIPQLNNFKNGDCWYRNIGPASSSQVLLKSWLDGKWCWRLYREDSIKAFNEIEVDLKKTLQHLRHETDSKCWTSCNHIHT